MKYSIKFGPVKSIFIGGILIPVNQIDYQDKPAHVFTQAITDVTTNVVKVNAKIFDQYFKDKNNLLMINHDTKQRFEVSVVPYRDLNICEKTVILPVQIANKMNFAFMTNTTITFQEKPTETKSLLDVILEMFGC
ncbi:hypothetical protein L0B53_19285 (plasmid) [Vibrio sp. SS-MA-C1-2]|uniref:hypothetical protein n=1 Tax=Vibrio sp. SS-MA-C1-2 TaxID=2908646 RepID=UPI001F394277|nr:hypothetical protein [Vibrio sp. SS-MA-C1-2]UJF20279.1 hypothetical protein L0B53_19285 [Vibrio sp. SS-MA-C1-2]